MEYIKLIGALMVVLAGAGLGACPVQKMVKRTKEMEELYFCLLRLKSEINHAVKPLPEAMKSATKVGNEITKGIYINVVEAVAEQMGKVGKSYGDLLAQCARELFLDSVITKEEQELFVETLLQLGGGDRERQVQALEYYAETVRLAMAEEKQKKKERAYLYRSLGILGGIFVSVILY